MNFQWETDYFLKHPSSCIPNWTIRFNYVKERKVHKQDNSSTKVFLQLKRTDVHQPEWRGYYLESNVEN